MKCFGASVYKFDYYAKKQLTLTNADKFVALATASVVAFELDDRIPDRARRARTASRSS